MYEIVIITDRHNFVKPIVDRNN